MSALSVEDFDRARKDPAVFAEALVGQPLWPHQLEVVRSSARYRVICAGRRAGKSRVFGVLALHQAFSVPGSKVLIVSAGERSAKRLFSEVAGMAAGSPVLRGSVSDESTSTLRLSTGSTVESVPSSMAQVRSAEADLLIVDEAAFVDAVIWEAAEPTVIARPGSRVLLCSTPWGDSDHFFRQLWTRGLEQPDERVQSWHWPSSVSPLVDDVLLEDIRERSSEGYFDREYLAVWGDAEGAYFSAAEIAGAVRVDRPLLDAAALAGRRAVGGIDWGQARDASTLVAIVLDEPATAARPDSRPVFRVAMAVERFGLPFHLFIDELVAVATRVHFLSLVTELNGIGSMPSQELLRALRFPAPGEDDRKSRPPRATSGRVVVQLTTTSQSKADGFGFLKLLLQQGRLLLPDHPPLLKQLRALRFEQQPAGGVRIAVPDNAGHDDLAMALSLAALRLTDDRQLAAPQLVAGFPSATAVGWAGGVTFGGAWPTWDGE